MKICTWKCKKSSFANVLQLSFGWYCISWNATYFNVITMYKLIYLTFGFVIFIVINLLFITSIHCQIDHKLHSHLIISIIIIFSRNEKLSFSGVVVVSDKTVQSNRIQALVTCWVILSRKPAILTMLWANEKRM